MMKTDEDRNVIGVLRGHSGFLERDGNALENLGVGWSLGVWLAQCRSLGGWSEQSWGSGRGSILDQMDSWKSDGFQQLNSVQGCSSSHDGICLVALCQQYSCVRCSDFHVRHSLHSHVLASGDVISGGRAVSDLSSGLMCVWICILSSLFR